MYLQFTDILCSSTVQTKILSLTLILPIIGSHFFVQTTEGNPSSPTRSVIASINVKNRINNVLWLNKNLIIGAVNKLFILNDTNLSVINTIDTGPLPDSPVCNSDLTSCIGNRDSITQTDNWNKLLLAVPGNRSSNTNGSDQIPPERLIYKLLVCGSTRQGTCEMLSFPELRRLPESDKLTHVPVAANDPDSSTVAEVSKDGEKIFVAASYTFDTPYRESFPAIATRALSNGLLPVNSGSLEGESAVFVRAEFRPQKINYVLTFQDEKYVYWASVQPKFAQASPFVRNPLVSKLIRVCRDDETYTSYSEIEIQCRSGEDNTHFNILNAMVLHNGEDLIGAFSDAENRNSAICAFSMAKIGLTFWYNLDRCRGGTDSIGLPHIGRVSKCIDRSHLPSSEDTCHLGVGGTIEASQVAAARFTERIITSVDARTIDEKSLVVLGTSDHLVIQLEMTGDHNSRRLRSYAQFTVGDQPIHRVLFLDHRRLLISTRSELMIFPVSSCQTGYKICSDCLSHGQNDPLCGWCLLDGELTFTGCARQSDCLLPILHECPKSHGLPEPRNASASSPTTTTIFVPISGLLPPTDGKISYECLFGTFQGLVKWTSKGIYCHLPSSRPRLLPGQESIRVPLSLRTGISRNSIVSHDFVFFNCSAHSTCSACTSSTFNCIWCPSERSCIEKASPRCKNKIYSSSGQCAQIDKNRIPEILIPGSKNASVSFPVVNIGSSSNLFCVFTKNTSQRSIRVSASLKQNTVNCLLSDLSFNESEPQQNFDMELIDGQEVIDKTIVTVYKCEKMALDCSQCLALDPKFRCSWCKSKCRLSAHSECSANNNFAQNPDPDLLCSNPIIKSIYPLFGPKEGGTRIEIMGKDLGSKIQDVQNRVRIADTICRVVEYTVSERIVCVVEKGNPQQKGPARITIGRSGRRVVESVEHFEFVDPNPTSIQPSFGPVSGGTRLQIMGENLRIGTNVSIYLDNLLCDIAQDAFMNESLTCITSPSPRLYTVTAVRLQIDSAVRLFNSRFEYRPDPTVITIEPKTAFENGGRKIFVKGTNFDSVLSAKMMLLAPRNPDGLDQFDHNSNTVSTLSSCQIINSTEMECESPRVLLQSHLHSSFSRWTVGFMMDGVESVRNLGSHVQLTTVPDPQFSAFTGVRQQHVGQPLMLEGRFLSLAADIDDFVVTIGTERCSVFILDTNRLLCRLPEKQVAPTDDSGDPIGGFPLVVVRIGSNIRHEIGPIELIGLHNELFGTLFVRMNLLKLSLLLLVIIGILIFVGFLFIWFWRRRSNEHEKVYKRIQLQMEQMECNVRNECKQAFAELQTEIMSDLTATGTTDLSGIPFQSKSEFVTRLLFRDSLDSGLPSLVVRDVDSPDHLSTIMSQFDMLIWNKQFISLLVQMIEDDTLTSNSERSTLGALLIATLSRNMGYCTEVVFSLLSTHIQKNIMMKTSHLLFRQSDSIVEKMFQHWLTICLYPYLTDSNGPGKAFFCLYRVLKYQTEKGPVDFVTGNSRYSLSETTLLRESVDAKPIALLIIPIDEFDQAPIVCKALECDTISQLKSKFLDLLYKNQPYSSRYYRHDHFDLEWTCPKRGSILLLDDDRPHIKGLKRLNTIGHYGLPSNALLTMQTRNKQIFTFRSGSSDTNSSTAWSFDRHTTQRLICSNDSSPEEGGTSDTIYYHLISFPAQINHKSSSIPGFYWRASLTEVFLTRMLMCKGAIQHFVNAFFDSVMFLNTQSQIPQVIKYVLDFLDHEAYKNNLADPCQLHAWKTNALILRFWMQLIHNPDCLFDVQRQTYIAGSLAVVGQTLMDAFSQSNLSLDKESPAAKLLFAKEISHYQRISGQLFTKIASQPTIPSTQFFDYIGSLSSSDKIEESLRASTALEELLNWVKANGFRLVEYLEEDPVSRNLGLDQRLRNLIRCSILQRSEHIYDTLR